MPNSILWIALVVLWVFVLFPMLADRHPRIRRTTDAALATRVLHRGGTRRRAKKGPATGHETDPDWVPTPRQKRLSHGDDAEDRMTTSADEPVIEDDRNAPERAESEVTRAHRSAGDPPGHTGEDEDHARETPGDAADAEPGEDERADLGAGDREVDGDPAGDARAGDADEADEGVEADDVPAAAETEDRPQGSMARIPPAPSAAVPARRGEVDPDDDVDDLDDRAGGEAESATRDFVPSRRGRGGFDPEADAIARAARYRFRQRTALGLILSTLLFGAFAIVVNAALWWGCALSVVALGAIWRTCGARCATRRTSAAAAPHGCPVRGSGRPRTPKPLQRNASGPSGVPEWIVMPPAPCAGARWCSTSTTRTRCSTTWNTSTPPLPGPPGTGPRVVKSAAPQANRSQVAGHRRPPHRSQELRAAAVSVCPGDFSRRPADESAPVANFPHPRRGWGVVSCQPECEKPVSTHRECREGGKFIGNLLPL
ncbi:divisome protein SepX/GlpR [Nocardia africana]|uniref:Uncharacterized protein n=1 Tax=Nocardia africana TaxID=134964 RepID=A0A378X5B4_9NOCA|nr:gephyrin-like molybdotransferase receptor GlpR [Nocardia africana]SUA48025.1 Uncharacterised protein [Nocardia africana]